MAFSPSICTRTSIRKHQVLFSIIPKRSHRPRRKAARSGTSSRFAGIRSRRSKQIASFERSFERRLQKSWRTSLSRKSTSRGRSRSTIASTLSGSDASRPLCDTHEIDIDK